ncbi:hypothetical protein PTTG_03698 [Puccinia triticina 1-1 BBBD Race 1]|uniref:Uncharacterized protein n=1 Tax=Puccinia triticina (isolate 1-1 / race 1 (BBBD)) TaxID=630390 RepID=A0A180GHR6_PUCT1|nr:hypothetical protein PTTG_03698 [Puccinia triticina 1-1 BBBD Race 1]
MPEAPFSSSIDTSADQTAKIPSASISTLSKPVGDTAKDWFKAVAKAQHAALVKDQEDRRADCKANKAIGSLLGQLEEMMLMWGAMKKENPTRSGQADTEKINMQKFCTSDRPVFCGPFQEIFFTTKDVAHSVNKIKIAGTLIAETNLMAFFANQSKELLAGTWTCFKTRIFEVALPVNWRMELKKQVKQLKMLLTESFQGFSTRARTLQSLINFDVAEVSQLGDFDLAQYVVFGLPEDLQDRLAEIGYMEASPFTYGY